MTTRLLIVAGFAVAVWGTARAEQSRDTPAPATAGTGAILGVVVTNEAAPQPVRRAIVTVRGGALRTERQTATDEQGRFALRSIPPGKYTVYASKPAWITSYFGSTHPGRPGPANVLVDVAAGQQHAGLTLRMIHGSAIAGIVRDANGRPANAGVSLMQLRTVDGARVVTDVPMLSDAGRDFVATDDEGAYRLYGIPPGEYVLSAQPVNIAQRDAHQFTADDLQAALNISRGGSEPHLATAADASPGRLANQGTTVTYASVYFPNALTVGDAVPIKVGTNEERTGVDVTLQLVPTATISGLVMASDGTPARQGQVQLIGHGAGVDSALSINIFSNVGPDGAFRLNAVPPGGYTILVLARGMSPASGGPGRAGQGGVQFWAAQDVTVEGRNLQDVNMTLQPGMTLAGRVQFSGQPSAPADMSRVRIHLESSGDAFSGFYFAQVDPSGTFTIPNLVPGPYKAVVAMVPGEPGQPKWTTESALIAGRDAIDLSVDIKPGVATPDLAVTFTDTAAEISGSLSDQSGKPASDYQVIVFAADRAFWLTTGRRMHPPVKCDESGAYRVADLPAGDYFIAVVADIDPDQLKDPSVLEDLAAHAVKVTVARGERRVQNLRIGAGTPPR